MPLGTMAALMLIIALLTGLLPETTEKLKLGRFPLLAALILAPVLRMATAELTPEIGLNAGALFTAAALFAAAIRTEKRRLLPSAALAIAAAFPSLLLRNNLEPDAAALAAGLAAVPALAVLRSLPGALLTSALAPAFTAVLRLVWSLLGGYAVLELTAADFDVQLLGVLFTVFAAELRRFNRRMPKQTAQQDKRLFFNSFRS